MPAGSSANTAPAWGTRPTRDCFTEAAAWQFAHEAVVGFDGDIEGVVKVESTVTTALVDLAAELAEHLVSVDQLDEHLGRVISGSMVSLKPEGSKRRGLRRQGSQNPASPSVGPILPSAAITLARLSARRDGLRRPMTVAAALAASIPQVGAEERSRYPASCSSMSSRTLRSLSCTCCALIFAPLQGQWS